MEAASLRDVARPLNGRTSRKMPKLPEVGQVFTLEREAFIFKASADAQIYAGMQDDNLKAAQTWAQAKARQGLAVLVPGEGQLVVKSVQRGSHGVSDPNWRASWREEAERRGKEALDAASRAQYAAAKAKWEAAERDSILNAMLSVDTLEGAAHGWVVFKVLQPQKKRKRK